MLSAQCAQTSNEKGELPLTVYEALKGSFQVVFMLQGNLKFYQSENKEMRRRI